MFINKLLIVLTPNLPLTPVAIVVQKKTDHSWSDEARNIGYLKRTTFFKGNNFIFWRNFGYLKKITFPQETISIRLAALAV